ncbi:hypothetical protein Bbelb_188890 [Branchiostoma belcheri]|nr:hypothetical protein Bbelb_188890 [Branchiostoma belcheri]
MKGPHQYHLYGSLPGLQMKGPRKYHLYAADTPTNSSVELAEKLTNSGVAVFRTGFIGRNLAEYLVSNELASKVRVVDKVPPATAWLGGRQKAIFERIEFKSANLINPASVQRAFDDDVTYDLVVNCASEGRLGQMEPVYNEGIVKLSVNCAKEASRRGARRYIELSTAHIYAPDKVASTEECKISPWTDIAQHKLKAEQEIGNIKGLNYVVLRPAIVYGPGDRTGLTPRMLVGAVYKELRETMRLLWSPELRTNTVHVTDVCRAIWHLRNNGNSGQVFNLADKGNTTQGQTTEFVSQIFGIQYEFLGSVISNVAKMTDSLPEVCEDLNEKHMEPWSAVCQRSGIVNTPLSPFLYESDTVHSSPECIVNEPRGHRKVGDYGGIQYQPPPLSPVSGPVRALSQWHAHPVTDIVAPPPEQLYNKHLCIDGSAIESTGFTYQHPHLTADSLREVMEGFAAQDLFPKSLLS